MSDKTLREAVEALAKEIDEGDYSVYEWEPDPHVFAAGLRAILSAPEPPREELREWQGEYICSVCHKEFGRPLGIAMIFYRSEHYLIGGRQCPGKLIPHERRKGGKVNDDLREQLSQIISKIHAESDPEMFDPDVYADRILALFPALPETDIAEATLPLMPTSKRTVTLHDEGLRREDKLAILVEEIIATLSRYKTTIAMARELEKRVAALSPAPAHPAPDAGSTGGIVTLVASGDSTNPPAPKRYRFAYHGRLGMLAVPPWNEYGPDNEEYVLVADYTASADIIQQIHDIADRQLGGCPDWGGDGEALEEIHRLTHGMIVDMSGPDGPIADTSDGYRQDYDEDVPVPPALKQCLRCGIMGYEMREGDGMGDPIDGCHECNSPVEADELYPDDAALSPAPAHPAPDAGSTGGIVTLVASGDSANPPAPKRWRCTIAKNRGVDAIMFSAQLKNGRCSSCGGPVEEVRGE